MSTKYVLAGFMMQFLTFSVLLGHDASAQMNKVIKADLDGKTLLDIFAAIENEAQVSFVYDSRNIDISRRLRIEGKAHTVRHILNKMCGDLQLAYKVINNTITVIEAAAPGEDLPRIPAERIRPGTARGMSLLMPRLQRSISGTVTDAASGDPLMGVSVLVRGTQLGTSTDEAGRYTLEEVPLNAVLVFSFIGYSTREIPLDNRSTLDVSLVEDPADLDQVVVVGYGTQRKVNLTGAVGSVEGERLIRRPVTNPVSMLQGQVPGVRIIQNSGEPGNEGLSVQIRGRGTFSAAGSDPLVLIDGVQGSLADLDPNNIENISVLKDAASASIYGSRAANGVILVTTKKGQEGAFRVNYTGNYAVHTPTKMLDLITNSAEYMELWNEAKLNTGINSGLYSQEQIDLYRNNSGQPQYPNADWLDIIFDPAPTHAHHLSFSGGSNGTTYHAALGYTDQQGIMKGFDYKKYNVRFNLSSQINPTILFGANLAAMTGEREGARQGSGDLFLSTLSQAPTYMPKLPDGSGRYTFKAYDFEQNNKNPLAIIENEVLRRTTDYGINLQGWADIKLAPSLNWYTKAAIVGDFSKWDDWRPIVSLYNYQTGEFMSDLDVGGQGLIVENNQNIYTNLYSYLNFEETIGQNHHLSAMLGYSQEENNYEFLNGYRRDYFGDQLRELNAGSPAVQNSSGTEVEWALRSFFGRLGYNFGQRYLLELNLRYDGSSRLHPDSRWGAFPSVSAAWRLTEEPFMKDAGISWLNDLKIRGSYGELGNQNIGNYPYQSLLALTGNYPFDNTNLSSGAAQTALANADITWETTQVLDFGLDLTVLKGLTLTFDWYKKKTTDILRSSQLTGIVGLDPPTINNGAMENTGIELNLQYRNQVSSGAFSGFTYNVGVYVDRFRNELVEFGEREIGGTTIKEEGRPWDTFYMLEWTGIFQSEEEIAAAPRQYNDNTLPGDLIFRDQNGDNVVNDDDRIPVGGQYPNFEYSFNFDAQWKGFDFSFFFQGVEGRKIFVNNWGILPFVQGSPPNVDWRNRWTEETPSTTMPRIYWGFTAPDKVRRNSTYYLKDASYLRLKNIVLGYTLPSSLTERFKVSRLRIYISGDNLLTFTDYPMLDPERTESGTFVNYPQNKIVSMGLTVQF